MKLQNKKTSNKRIGEQGLIKDELLLDWFPKGAKDLTIGYPDTTTLNFMQRGSKKREKQYN